MTTIRLWLGGIALALTVLALPSAARAESDTLYGALVMATNVEHPTEAPAEIKAQADNLRSIFGYNQFSILGQRRKAVVAGTEDWLISSPKFFLRVDTKMPVPGGYALGLQLFREKKLLTEAQVKLTRTAPLFIRGPLIAKGQLIIVLMIQ